MNVSSLRLGKKLERMVQGDIRDFNFSTKTEYIRQAIRELHERLDTERAIRKLAKTKGFAKRAGYKEPTPEEYERNRQEAAEELFAGLKARQASKL
jgi:Arc/MetJ-type ribon-helix-helix transcriptional regulator